MPAPIGTSEPQTSSTLSVADLLRTLWRQRTIVGIVFAVCLGISAIVTFSLPKVYSADSVLLVNSGIPGTQISSAQESDLLTKTYAELVQTRAVADDVATKLPFEMSGGQVAGSVSVSPVSGSQLLRVSAEDRNAGRAAQIANIYAEVVQSKSAALADQAAGPAKVTIAERALVPTSPVRPKPALYLMIGAVLSALLAAGLALLSQRLRNQLQVEPSTTSVLGLPVIGRVPELGFDPLATMQSRLAWRVTSEPWRFLLANLDFAVGDEELRSVAVVSSGEGEGKSTCAVNLARAAAERGTATLLVDADLRLGAVSGFFESPPDGGFSTLLAEPEPGASIEAATVAIPDTGLIAIPAGPVPTNPSALLSSNRLGEFARRAAQEYELVVFDTPPLRVGADASMIAAEADAVLLVIDARTKRSAAVRAIDQLERARANLIGLVLNRFPEADTEPYGTYGKIEVGDDGTVVERPSERPGTGGVGSPRGAGTAPGKRFPQQT